MTDPFPDIAFIGKMGAGKSSLAKMFRDAYGYQQLSFARTLKETAAYLWDEPTREQLQQLGVALRGIDEDVFVRPVMKKVNGHRFVNKVNGRPSDNGAYAIDDTRFPNEYWALRGAGFKVVRLQASEAKRIERLKGNGRWTENTDLNHISETAIDELEADITYVNEDVSIFEIFEALTAQVDRWRAHG